MTRLDLYQPDMSKRSYWLGIFLAIDQFMNTVFFGYPDETISSRAFRCNDKKIWRIAEQFINTLFWFDTQGDIKHCELAYYGEVVREHFPITKR